MTLRRLRHFLLRDERGVSSVEFALIVPVLLLILAGVVDLGGAIKAKFDLNSAVSAAANFAMLNGESVTSAEGTELAAQVATIAMGGLSGGQGRVEVLVNDGPKLVYADGATQASTTAGRADKCYCPTRSGGTITFGNPATCGSVCASGATAGKFVVIRASKPHNPLFGGFGVIEAGNVNLLSVVQPK